MKSLELAPGNWSSSFWDAVERSLVDLGPIATLKTIVSGVLEGSSVPLPQDSFTHLVGLMMSQRSSVSSRPFSTSFIYDIVPNLLDGTALTSTTSTLTAVTALCRAIKQVLLVTSLLDSSKADEFVGELVEELTEQRARPSKPPHTKPSSQLRRGPLEIGAKDKAALEAVIGALAGDEELRSRWPKVGDLLDGPV